MPPTKEPWREKATLPRAADGRVIWSRTSMKFLLDPERPKGPQYSAPCTLSVRDPRPALHRLGILPRAPDADGHLGPQHHASSHTRLPTAQEMQGEDHSGGCCFLSFWSRGTGPDPTREAGHLPYPHWPGRGRHGPCPWQPVLPFLSGPPRPGSGSEMLLSCSSLLAPPFPLSLAGGVAQGAGTAGAPPTSWCFQQSWSGAPNQSCDSVHH